MWESVYSAKLIDNCNFVELLRFTVSLMTPLLFQTNTRGRLLFFFTPGVACVSGLSLLVALCGKEWIRMEERILNTTVGEFSLKREFYVKKTYAGLFNICKTDRKFTEFGSPPLSDKKMSTA